MREAAFLGVCVIGEESEKRIFQTLGKKFNDVYKWCG
jgi:hypothetical protein